MSTKLIDTIVHSSSEYKCRTDDGEGGTILHQVYPVRYFEDLSDSGCFLALSVFISKEIAINELVVLETALYQNGSEIGSSATKYSDNVATTEVKDGYIVSWREGVATPNATEGMVEIKLKLLMANNNIDVEGSGCYFLNIGDPGMTNKYFGTLKNALMKISKTYKSYVYNQSNE